MLENFVAQFVLELVRALLIEEMSSRVRRPLVRLLARHRSRRRGRAFLTVHRRNRDRLMHRLFTEMEDEL